MTNNHIALIITILFWSTLFMITPILEIETKFDRHFEIKPDGEDESSVIYQDDSQNQTFDIYPIAILLYGIFLTVMLTIPDEKLKNIRVFSYSFIISLVGVILASISYHHTSDIADYEFAYLVISSIPTILISHYLIRCIYKLFGKTNPTLVGEDSIFEDFENWLFSTLVLLIGMGLGMWINLVVKLDNIILQILHLLRFQ